MIKKLQSLPLGKRKIILYTVTGVIALLLVTFQIFSAVEKTREANFKGFFFPEESDITSEIRERQEEMIKTYQSAKEGVSEALDLEKTVEKMIEEGELTQEEAESLFKEKKEETKEEELLKEENGQKKE